MKIGMDTNRITLLNKLLEILEQFKISYAIVGRTESYPESIGCDIDLMIHVEDLEKFHKEIWNIDLVMFCVIRPYRNLPMNVQNRYYGI